ncbi:hypothetical protein [Haladaptatus sp. DFWS20]|uniref:hypothetical protein n=1 Tax=Haladaptatus sp. DFWS20 TaxID=3403467 RepID=UPI003EC08E14
MDSRNIDAGGTLLLVALPTLVLVGYTVAVGLREHSAFTGTRIETYYARLVLGVSEVPTRRKTRNCLPPRGRGGRRNRGG